MDSHGTKLWIKAPLRSRHPKVFELAAQNNQSKAPKQNIWMAPWLHICAPCAPCAPYLYPDHYLSNDDCVPSTRIRGHCSNWIVWPATLKFPYRKPNITKKMMPTARSARPWRWFSFDHSPFKMISHTTREASILITRAQTASRRLECIEIPSPLPLHWKVNKGHGLDGIEMLAASTIYPSLVHEVPVYLRKECKNNNCVGSIVSCTLRNQKQYNNGW